MGSGFSIFFETPREKLSFFFFKNLVLKNDSTDFQKSGTKVESAHYSVCLHNPLVSFYPTPLSTAFEKVCGGILDPNCWVFF